MFTKTKVSRAHEIQFSVSRLLLLGFFLRANLCLFPFYSDLDIKMFVQLIIQHTLSRNDVNVRKLNVIAITIFSFYEMFSII